MMKNKRRHEKRIFDYLGTITVNFDPQISTLPLMMNNKQITKENKTNDDDPDVFAKVPEKTVHGRATLRSHVLFPPSTTFVLVRSCCFVPHQFTLVGRWDGRARLSTATDLGLNDSARINNIL
ncbi:hypothetical protein OUZ56_014857 [Daphnia magna]|uniref:Uncharacterized protein n=1 Tax=Daphnia magna TaxID=35525 RepID=A0ABR0AL12_9CRUS|nr:hypothetical protein OUZ56_014857 [Daphnia magna]